MVNKPEPAVMWMGKPCYSGEQLKEIAAAIKADVTDEQGNSPYILGVEDTCIALMKLFES